MNTVPGNMKADFEKTAPGPSSAFRPLRSVCFSRRAGGALAGLIGVASLIGIALAVALVRADVPAGRGGAVPHGSGPSQSCAECHRGRVQATHDAAFVAVTHGAAAVADRVQCLGCHRTEQCHDCHVRQAPPWHTEAVREPARDRGARQEHARAGLERRAGCIECHEERFIAHCGECHRMEEWTP